MGLVDTSEAVCKGPELSDVSIAFGRLFSELLDGELMETNKRIRWKIKMKH